MGLFNKIKNTFKKEKKEESVNNENEIKIYDQGLTKTRENFVSKLVNLTNKYSKELKLEIVKRYLRGESPSVLANEYCISSDDLIYQWITRYRIMKDKAFDSSLRNKEYSKELKLTVIREYLSGYISYDEFYFSILNCKKMGKKV